METTRANTLSFALAYVLTHSVFLTTFSAVHLQLTVTAPMIPAIMGIVFLVCIIILFVAAFSLFGLIGGASFGGDEHASPASAASAALGISDIPFDGPIAEVRVGRVNGQFVINPTFSTLGQSDMDISVMFLVGGVHGNNYLGLTPEPIRKHRSDRSVNQS